MCIKFSFGMCEIYDRIVTNTPRSSGDIVILTEILGIISIALIPLSLSLVLSLVIVGVGDVDVDVDVDGASDELENEVDCC